MPSLRRRFRQRLARICGAPEIDKRVCDVSTFSPTTSAGVKENQLLLRLAYQRLKRDEAPALPLAEVEFRSYSQNGEDGILWYIFSLIGEGGARAVEICAGDGRECNTANLILNHGWEALLVDGNPEKVEAGTSFYKGHPDTCNYPPRFLCSWIDTANVNDLISAQGFEGEIDLLSLDIDGIDYWLWQAITVVRPRVVVLESQVIWGADRSVTVPYRSDFRAEYVDGFGVYSGASLPAFVKLARSKGYRLVGTQRYGYNAFFLRDDVGVETFPEVTAQQCLTHPFVRWAQSTLLPLVKDKEWIEV